MAGNVENGATIDYANQKSAGRDDIVVAKLSTRDGNVAWLKQIGSNGDDRVAFSGGVKVDAHGNAVVFGNTNGSFFRERNADGQTEHYSDLFVMTFNQDDGSHVKPVVATSSDMLPPDTSVPEEWYPNGVPATNMTVQTMSFGIIALLLIVVVFFVFASVVAKRENGPKPKKCPSLPICNSLTWKTLIYANPLLVDGTERICTNWHTKSTKRKWIIEVPFTKPAYMMYTIDMKVLH